MIKSTIKLVMRKITLLYLNFIILYCYNVISYWLHLCRVRNRNNAYDQINVGSISQFCATSVNIRVPYYSNNYNNLFEKS